MARLMLNLYLSNTLLLLILGLDLINKIEHVASKMNMMHAILND